MWSLRQELLTEGRVEGESSQMLWEEAELTESQRHILVKGCGKAQAEAEAKKAESQSAELKVEKLDVKPPMQS